MKRLILIQNDYSGAGKTTLSRCLHQYLENYRVPHHLAVLTETPDESSPTAQIDTEALQMATLIGHLDRSDLVLLEVESGLAQFFNKFCERHDLPGVLDAMGFDLIVALPVTEETESFDGVTEAAEAFGDCAQFLVVHTPSSTVYDADNNRWERSYAARVMDMFEAVDMDMPSTSHSLDRELMNRHLDLAGTLQGDPDPALSDELSKWFKRAASQVDAVRKYAFGDAFRPAIALARPAANRRTRRAKPLAQAQAA